MAAKRGPRPLSEGNIRLGRSVAGDVSYQVVYRGRIICRAFDRSGAVAFIEGWNMASEEQQSLRRKATLSSLQRRCLRALADERFPEVYTFDGKTLTSLRLRGLTEFYKSPDGVTELRLTDMGRSALT
jgi:hypothetical protein